MNYKLCKQLKDAGFPGTETCEKNELYHPTLSQLIEACGDEFFSIQLQNKQNTKDNKDNWFATSNREAIQTEGKTPESAVANLWLKLNNK